MAYQYQELNDEGPDFRLLILKPGAWDTDIACDLLHESLASAPPYEALSYVWGELNPARSIHLEGHLHNVTSNLYSALQRLRLEHRDRVLWVDALCINQHNLDERSAQVLKMHSIYSKASQVLSWLGESSEDSDEAMELILKLGCWVQEHEDDLIERLSTENTVAYDIFEELGFSMASRNWQAFWDLFNRPYWTRVWIIQELAASGTLHRAKGTLLCGSSSVHRRLFDYTCVVMVLVVIMGNSVRPDFGEFEEPMRSMMVKGHPPGLSMLQMLAACNPRDPRPLEWLLRISSRFESTEARDKIYSLLGLARKEHREFKPDYTKPLDLVLQELVQFIVHTSGNLNILLGTRLYENPDGPSWTPILSREFHNNTVLAVPEGTFTASGGKAPLVFFNPSSGTMTAKGLLIGKVNRVIGPWKRATQLPTDAAAIQAEAERLGYHSMYRDLAQFGQGLDQQGEDSFWRTLVMNLKDGVSEKMEPAPDSFREMYRVFFQKQPAPADFMPAASSAVRTLEYSRPYHTIMNVTVGDRCFFSTDCGRMCLGAYCARPGDIIVVLLGSPFCLVLREKGTAYTLVGDAYVHGIMGGELVESKGEEELQDFVLV